MKRTKYGEQREYRVIWQREGRVQQIKRYALRKHAELRFGLLTSPEPWLLIGRDETDYVCCNGAECACGGLNYRQRTENIQRETPLKYARIESRLVGAWEPVQ